MSDDWTAAQVKEYLETLIREQDRRMGEAMLHQEQAAAAALAAAVRASDKAERSVDRHFQTTNAYREQLTSQAQGFMPRIEYEQRHSQLTEAVNDVRNLLNTDVLRIEKRVDSMENRSAGLRQGWGWLIAAISLLATLIVIANFVTR